MLLFLLNFQFSLQFGCLWFQATNENLPPNVIKQLAKELKHLDESPPEGINVGVNDDDFSTIFADIDGPGMLLLCLLNAFQVWRILRLLLI